MHLFVNLIIKKAVNLKVESLRILYCLVFATRILVNFLTINKQKCNIKCYNHRNARYLEPSKRLMEDKYVAHKSVNQANVSQHCHKP